MLAQVASHLCGLDEKCWEALISFLISALLLGKLTFTPTAQSLFFCRQWIKFRFRHAISLEIYFLVVCILILHKNITDRVLLIIKQSEVKKYVP